MSSSKEIVITINGQTHRFQADDLHAIKAMPWEDRKQLIGLLDTIRQAEFVAAADAEVHTPAGHRAESTTGQPTEKAPPQANSAAQRPIQTQSSKMDPQADFRSQNPDDLMQQLIMQEKQHSRSIPDRMTVVKYMLAVIVVIILVSMLF